MRAKIAAPLMLALLPSAGFSQVPGWQNPAPVPPRNAAPPLATPASWSAPGVQPSAIAPGSLTPGASMPPGAASGSLAPGALNSATGNSAGSAAPSWNTAQPGWNIPGKPPLTAARSAVDPVAAARLRAAGLDPADPNFSSRLNARLASMAAPPQTQGWKPATARSGANVQTLSVVRTALVAKMRSASSISGAFFAGAAHRNLVKTLPPSPGSGQNLTLTTTGLFDAYGAQPANGAMSMPTTYLLAFMAPTGMALPTDLNYSGHVHFSVPDCHAESDADAGVLQRDSRLAMSLQIVPPTLPATGIALFLMPMDDASGSAWTMALGASAHTGTMSFQYGGYSAAMTLQFSGSVQSEVHSLIIGSTPPLSAAGNDLGLKDTAFLLQSPTVQRFNTTGTPMTGTDTIALNAPLGPAYSATATVSSARSVADVGNDSSPDNQYRGATVTMQPGAGRLQTAVQWHIGPGDSLQYTIQWTFVGPFGQRPLLTMPLRGPCDS